MNSSTMSIVMLVGLMVIMYLLLIRPQRKREKAVTSMRNSIEVGDEVVTIGGMIGKVVKTTDDVLTVQLGDKNKIEIYRWGISKNVSAERDAEARKEAEKSESSVPEEEPQKPARPKKMKKPEVQEQEKTEADGPVEEKSAEDN